MRKKLIALLCGLLALLMLLAGCKDDAQGGEPTDSVSESEAESETEPDANEEEVVPTKVADYVLITPKSMTDWETDMVNSIYSSIEKKTKTKLDYEEENYTEDTDTRY